MIYYLAEYSRPRCNEGTRLSQEQPLRGRHEQDDSHQVPRRSRVVHESSFFVVSLTSDPQFPYLQFRYLNQEQKYLETNLPVRKKMQPPLMMVAVIFDLQNFWVSLLP